MAVSLKKRRKCLWVGGRTVSSEPSICPLSSGVKGTLEITTGGDATKGSGKADGVLYHQYFSSKITAGTVSAMDMQRETGHAAEVRTKEVSWHSFDTNFLIRVKRNLLVTEAWPPNLTALSSQPPFCLGLKHRPDHLQPI